MVVLTSSPSESLLLHLGEALGVPASHNSWRNRRIAMIFKTIGSFKGLKKKNSKLGDLFGDDFLGKRSRSVGEVFAKINGCPFVLLR